MIVVVFGLPGVGKTTLSKEIARRTNGIHINADDVRKDLSSDLGFSVEDRVEQARRLGAMARLLSNQGHLAIVDFINPTYQTREAFGKYNYSVWVNRKPVRNYEDTTNLFQIPENSDIVIGDNLSVNEEAVMVLKTIGVLDWTEPTTLMLGRYQPWHEGHQALKDEAHKRTEQVLIGVRNTHGTSEKDPLPYEDVVEYIRRSNEKDSSVIMKLPNITNIVYGRDVGYKIEQVDLGADIHAISATQKRKEMGI